MNFTDKSELEEIVSYSKTYRPKMRLFEDCRSTFEDNFLSYEEIIENSFEDDPQKIPNLDIIKENLLDDTTETLLLDIINFDDKLTLKPLIIKPIADTRRKSKEHEIIMHSSLATEEKKVNRIKRHNTAVYDQEKIVTEENLSPSARKNTNENVEIGINKTDPSIENIIFDQILEIPENKNKIQIEKNNEIEDKIQKENNTEKEDNKEKEILLKINTEKEKENKKEENKNLLNPNNVQAKRRMSAANRRGTTVFLGDEKKKLIKKILIEPKSENNNNDKFSSKLKGILDASSLGKSIHTHRSNLNLYQMSSKQKYITVYFFGTPQKLKIPIPLNSLVKDAIRIIIDFYLGEKDLNQDLLKYSYEPEAYELRFLEDDDDYKPEMSFDPLDLNRKLTEYNIDSLAFCEVANFKPIVNGMSFINANSIRDNINSINKEKKMQEIIEKQKKIPISVRIENYTTIIAIESQYTITKEDKNKPGEIQEEIKYKFIRDIFPLLQKKYKFNPNKYIVRLLINDESDLESINAMDEVDINMPLFKLKQNKLIFVKKVFADDPEIPIDIKEESYSLDNSSLLESDIIDSSSILMNEITASRYEEFEVVKINSRNKKQPRILGIDQFKLYNKLKPKETGITNIFNNIFSANYTTKNPQRFIESIQEVDIIKGFSNQFYIDILEPNNKLKRITYEVKNKKMCAYIIAKIKFLIGEIKKKRRKITNKKEI